jgi:hypothetical protein
VYNAKLLSAEKKPGFSEKAGLLRVSFNGKPQATALALGRD